MLRWAWYAGLLIIIAAGMMACGPQSESTPAETASETTPEEIAEETTAEQEAVPEKPKSGFPELGEDEMWVSSVPTGLDVYVGSDTETLIEPGNIIGTTPLIFKRTEEHKFVAVAPEDIDAQWADKLIDPHPEKLERTTADIFASSVTYKIVEDEGERRLIIAFVYDLEKLDRNTLISLFQWSKDPLSTYEDIFPKEETFRFDEETMRMALSNLGITDEATVSKAMEYLRRGGKVAVNREDDFITIELLSDDTFQLQLPE
jgi:hypothetical protein